MDVIGSIRSSPSLGPIEIIDNRHLSRHGHRPVTALPTTSKVTDRQRRPQRFNLSDCLLVARLFPQQWAIDAIWWRSNRRRHPCWQNSDWQDASRRSDFNGPTSTPNRLRTKPWFFRHPAHPDSPFVSYHEMPFADGRGRSRPPPAPTFQLSVARGSHEMRSAPSRGRS